MNACTNLGWFNYFIDLMYKFEENSPMDSTCPTGPVNIDAYVFIAWCMHCTIARMSSGSLIPYQGASKTEAFNYLSIHRYIYHIMKAPLFTTYSRIHLLIIKNIKEQGKGVAYLLLNQMD